MGLPGFEPELMPIKDGFYPVSPRHKDTKLPHRPSKKN